MPINQTLKGNEALHGVIGSAFVESLDKFKGEMLTFIESNGGENTIIEARKSIVRRMFKSYDWKFQGELKEIFEELKFQGEFVATPMSAEERLAESTEVEE